MATTLHEPLADPGAPQPSSVLVHWARLVSGLAALPAVTKLGMVAAGGSVDLWVLMADEDDVAEAEVSRLERDFRVAVGPIPFDLHVAPVSIVNEANLPSFETVFSR